MINTAPCHKCPNREAGCHSYCEDYLEFKSIREINKKKMYKQKQQAKLIDSYTFDRVEKDKRRRK